MTFFYAVQDEAGVWVVNIDDPVHDRRRWNGSRESACQEAERLTSDGDRRLDMRSPSR